MSNVTQDDLVRTYRTLRLSEAKFFACADLFIDVLHFVAADPQLVCEVGLAVASMHEEAASA